MSETIDNAKQVIEAAKNRLLTTFAHVPDDRLHWTPSPTAKSAQRIAAHAAIANFGFAAMTRGERLPADNLADVVRLSEAKELAVTSREQAVAIIEESTRHLLSAIDALTPERLRGDAYLPIGPMPMASFIFLGARHAEMHAGQIDYLQTIWGDLEFRI